MANDEGFMRNVRAIFGPGNDYEGMGDSPLAFVKLSADKEDVTFGFANGYEARFRVTSDCCSSSWIEHLEIAPGAIGEKLIEIEDALISRDDDHPEHECLQVYHTRFKTAKGDIVLEYRNSSNGYYGGMLERDRG